MVDTIFRLNCRRYRLRVVRISCRSALGFFLAFGIFFWHWIFFHLSLSLPLPPNPTVWVLSRILLRYLFDLAAMKWGVLGSGGQGLLGLEWTWEQVGTRDRPKSGRRVFLASVSDKTLSRGDWHRRRRRRRRHCQQLNRQIRITLTPLSDCY